MKDLKRENRKFISFINNTENIFKDNTFYCNIKDPAELNMVFARKNLMRTDIKLDILFNEGYSDSEIENKEINENKTKRIGTLKGDLYNIDRMEKLANKDEVFKEMDEKSVTYAEWYHCDLEKMKSKNPNAQNRNNVFFVYEFELSTEYRTPEVLNMISESMKNALFFFFNIKTDWFIILPEAILGALGLKKCTYVNKMKAKEFMSNTRFRYFDYKMSFDEAVRSSDRNMFLSSYFYKRL